MADFSPTGLPELGTTSAQSLQSGDPRVLGWLREAIQEGDLINRSDPSYEHIGRAQEFIVGEQLSRESKALPYLPQIIVNESRKAMQAHVSALTDLKPLFGWRAPQPFQVQADLLNQYAIAEWVTHMYDLDLGDCIKYALAAGTGDLVVDWDPHVPLGGAHQLTARDPRDTLPLRPSQGRSLQSWEGVILREEHSVNVLRGMYPTKAWLFKNNDNTLSTIMGRFRNTLSRLVSPGGDALDQLGKAHTKRAKINGLVLYRAYLRDRTRNLTGRDLVMGTPGTAWAYIVKPDDPIYPRGRLIVATDGGVLFDGPNTYWHGMFPVARLKLWSVPWQFLGVPLFNDLLPVQEAINDTLHDLRLGIRQWLNPDVVFNRNAVSESTMRLLDPRKPGKRIKVQPGYGDPYNKLDGPSPQILSMALELWQQLTQKFTDLSGTANLSALLQLRQLPSADTIQKYYEALTPEIRHEARQVEAFLRDVAEMVKVNYFQFLTTAKRVQVLGPAGVTINDFDYDPGKMVPALKPGDDGYTPELDVDLTTADQRAQFFHKQFVFIVAPNSLLAMNAQEAKMTRLQLYRMGAYDFWSLHETLETPNIGAPPATPLPPIEPPPAGIEMMLIQQAMQGGMLGVIPQFTDPATGRTFTMDPSGQVLELRVPTTVTERLMAQNLMGIGVATNAAGRKASGQESPQLEEKSDGEGGTRQTMTESKK